MTLVAVKGNQQSPKATGVFTTRKLKFKNLSLGKLRVLNDAGFFFFFLSFYALKVHLKTIVRHL